MGRTLIGIETLLTGFLYLSFGVFVFKIAQMAMGPSQVEEARPFREARKIQDDDYSEMTKKILPYIEKVKLKFNLI